MNCPFYGVCDKPKNPGFCESTENLLLCKEYIRLEKIHEIKERADKILEKGKRIRL